MSEIPKEIKKINEVTWEIPTSYKQGMNVPARIIATESLLKAMDPGVFNQVTNVATLPGIVKYSICHADGHWGYGFPIGGVAAFDMEEGVISPGGIGFDINCLHPDTEVLSNLGYSEKIKELNKETNVVTFNLKTKDKEESIPILFQKRKEKKILAIKSKLGKQLKVSKDHPIFTNRGMMEAEKLKIGDNIACYFFSGVRYEKPKDDVLIEEGDIRKVHNSNKIINELKKKNLLPLRTDSPKLPILTKLLGFVTGDGCIYSKHHYWKTIFIGKKEDLEKIQKDILDLGFNPWKISSTKLNSKIAYRNGEVRYINGTTTRLDVNSNALSVLLFILGAPKGRKSEICFEVPKWLFKTPKWIKRLYLAGLFGAELTKPILNKKEPYRFKEPRISLNKEEGLMKNGYDFLNDLKELLKEFNIITNRTYIYPIAITKNDKKTIKLILSISSKNKNLIDLWSKIGYEYCKEREIKSSHAVAYLLFKQKTIEHRDKIKKLLRENNNTEEVMIGENNLKSLKTVMHTKSIIPQTFLTFDSYESKFCEQSSPLVWDEIEEIKEINHNDYVYDFTVNHDSHNFIANNIVVSNCGMRSIVTNLTLKEVQPKIKELTDTLFKLVPAGVGCKGFVKVDNSQFEEVMQLGSKWCVEKGYGWQEDLERTEDYGTLKGADPEKVSQKALSRGINQLGTLGSGNHYLEVQIAHAENIYDEKTAKKLGIVNENQVIITTHCGSRGFGHQNATDYLKVFDRVMKEYKIHVPDRELSCAPFKTQEAQDYYSAMKCSGNMAYANRQVIMHRIREAFQQVFKQDAEKLGMHLIYDCTHNLAREHKIKVDGKTKKVLVHLKGATTSVGPGYERLTRPYQDLGSPIIIGGSMETGSYLMIGTKKAEEETFATTIHGAGRTMSRTKAKKAIRGEVLQRKMMEKGIYVRGVSMSGLAEEAGFAYKDLKAVGDSVEKAGISKRIVLLKPIGNVKG